ncbi:MAG: hypothetical protein EOO54_13950 [Haliea sp.]|nr:MAG: hypothetical protein EOO54_13950 [Haliea sp.]
MTDTPTSSSSQLDRIEQLLRDGNALQAEALAAQRSLVEAQRANLEKASLINDHALRMQKQGNWVTVAIIVVILGMVAYMSYLLFAKSLA